VLTAGLTRLERPLPNSIKHYPRALVPEPGRLSETGSQSSFATSLAVTVTTTISSTRLGYTRPAAPIYFPSVDGLVDVGIYANNPSMCALAQSHDARSEYQLALSDIVLLSLGTGTLLTYIRHKTLDWGYTQWAKPLVNLMLDGLADWQCKQILGDRYFRLSRVFPVGVSVRLDGVSRIPELIDFAS